MPREQLKALMQFFGQRVAKYFAWRGTSDKPAENEEEMAWLDEWLVGLKRIHTSYISETLGVAAIWKRQ
jgi:hypothetical protein